ncbi:MAG: GNAT family N-acetyltransferase [Spirochaetia bacterium]
MRAITIKELNKDNWYDCCELSLTPEQEEFMEPNAVSIAQTKYEPSLRAYAIYDDNTIVGFCMYNSEPEELDGYWIYRIMIDKEHQRKGIGKAATEAMIQEMAQIPGCNRIVVGYHHENLGAHNLYKRCGFKDHGHRFGVEKAVLLDL